MLMFSSPPHDCAEGGMIDEYNLAASLDDEWRSPSVIKRMSQIRGRIRDAADALRRLAEAGAIERMTRDTGHCHLRVVGNGLYFRPFKLEFYRRCQVVLFPLPGAFHDL